MDTILNSERLVNRYALKPGRNEQAHQVGDHQRNDDGIVLRHFEDHEHRGHGSTNDTGKHGAHPDQRVGPGGGRSHGEEVMCDVADGPAEHGTQEECRPEDPPRVA